MMRPQGPAFATYVGALLLVGSIVETPTPQSAGGASETQAVQLCPCTETQAGGAPAGTGPFCPCPGSGVTSSAESSATQDSGGAASPATGEDTGPITKDSSDLLQK